MTDNRRLSTAFLFLGLSAATYIVPTGLALLLFQQNLTSALDNELKEFMASFGHAITLQNGRPQFRDWSRIVKTEPERSLVTYQLFDADTNLLEAHGQPGIPILYKNTREERRGRMSMRTLMTALKNPAGKTIGYLQIQLSTQARDEAVRQLATVNLIVAPIVLLGLAYCSFLVSERAAASVHEVNNKLRRFIADASHELNTPLTIFDAAVESAQKKLEGIDAGREELDIALSAVDRMETILADLMLLSTIEAGTITPEKKTLMLSSLLNELVAEFRPKFEQKEITIIAHNFTEDFVSADRASLSRLFSNLLDNAWRYCDRGGIVKVSMSREGHSLKVSIADSGVGIPPQALSKIFDRFYRVDRSRSRESGGSGLGLSIAMAIAANHGGTIDAQSEVGRGSLFTVVLPTTAQALE